MSIVVRFQPTNLTVEQYEGATSKLEEAGIEFPPEGLDVHVCFGSDGDLRVSEIWDSREKFDAFAERLVPALQEAGIEFSGEPEVYQVHGLTKR
ncbi:MAG TPA: hypothetical protein VD790_03840 [Thermoleophilaceae bacterium]|nr:hypothetical protein [Thermoleophilaceae bacterium]